MSSFNRVTFTGAEDTIPVPFGYIDKSHVAVTLNGTPTTAFSWLSAGLIKLSSVPSSGVVGEARRSTPSSRLVVFSPGNLDVDDLNVSTWQAILIAEEAKDSLSDLRSRGWVTSGYQLGGTITKAGLGYVPTFDADGNLTGATSAADISAAQGYASAAYSYLMGAQDAKGLADTAANLAAGYAASVNPANFYTKTQVDGFRTTDQNSAKDAGNLTSGTVPDARMPLSLQPLAQANVITDCNAADHNGWYAIEASGLNKPSSSGGYVVTIAKHTDWWVQYFFTQTEDANNQRRWRRYRAGSTWGPWVRIYEAEAELLALVDAQIAATVHASTSPNVHIFTSSGTYTKSSGLKWAKITVIGGGGGGASGTPTGNGGGGGGTAIKYASASEIGATNSVIVGAGGNAGSGGGNSTINLGSVTVTGGGGGVGGGGAGTNGTLNISGGHGLSYYCGGSTIFPGGGAGGASSGTANTGGGGGSGRSGGSGVVIIEEYF